METEAGSSGKAASEESTDGSNQNQIIPDDGLENANKENVNPTSNTRNSSNAKSDEAASTKRLGKRGRTARVKPRLFRTEKGWLSKRVSLNTYLENQATKRRLQQAREKRRSRKVPFTEKEKKITSQPKASDTFIETNSEVEKREENNSNITNVDFDDDFDDDGKEEAEPTLMQGVEEVMEEEQEREQDSKSWFAVTNGCLQEDDFAAELSEFNQQNQTAKHYEDRDLSKASTNAKLSIYFKDNSIERTALILGLNPTVIDLSKDGESESKVMLKCPWCDFAVSKHKNALIWHCLARHGKQEHHPDLQDALRTKSASCQEQNEDATRDEVVN